MFQTIKERNLSIYKMASKTNYELFYYLLGLLNFLFNQFLSYGEIWLEKSIYFSYQIERNVTKPIFDKHR